VPDFPECKLDINGFNYSRFLIKMVITVACFTKTAIESRLVDVARRHGRRKPGPEKLTEKRKEKSIW
jgi:hypothetical protein